MRHFGYVGLFPFLLQLVPADSPKLGRVVENLLEPHLLFSEFGLRSLSRIDKFFGKEEDYWRGKIWLNINYLALRSLRHYADATQADAAVRALAARAYKELRENLVNNLFKQYRRSGFVWENYSAKNGRGAGCHPFTGWSALIVAIMGEQY